MEACLRGKNALITGGGSGIGFGIAEVLAEEGVNLCIASRNPPADSVATLKGKGIDCFSLSIDVSREDQAIEMVEKTIKTFGTIDFYINNAAGGWHEPVLAITTDAIMSTMTTNLFACIWACREVGKHMKEREKGGIVIIGSTSRLTPNFNESMYRVSKMGLYMFMQNLAIEYAPYNIRVNMVTPGHFKTRLTSKVPEEAEKRLIDLMLAPRFGKTKEIGYAVAFLLSDELSGYTWGSDIVIDGGLSHRPIKLFDSH